VEDQELQHWERGPASRTLDFVSDDLGPGRAARVARPAFRYLNRWLMVPMLRAGLGAWMGTPLGGWILLLRTRGRRSGIVRIVPLSYLIADGSVWIAAGFGERTHWLLNIAQDPLVEIVLPGRALRCRASVVRDEVIRAAIVPRFVRATGLPALLGGIDPYFSAPAKRLEAMRDVPLVRLDPLSGQITAGPDDPGGRGWIWRQGLLLFALGLALKGAAVARRARLRR
jgi:deazaflavin-dependent oxidoreductase (nitroreductase family)